MFVGRNTSGGNRDFYFYTNDPEAFRSTAGEAMGRFSAYQYEIGTREDRNWRTYFNFLHPSERSMQLILNRRVRRLLEQNGDSLRNERQIDHLARLPSPEAQSAFASYVKNEGFAIASIPAEPDEEGQYLVDFSKFGLPTQIDDLVLSLFDKAAELGGVYDGWGCEATP